MSTPDLEQAFLPQEAAKYLGISVQKLGRLRRDGKIIGKRVGTTNLYTYTAANLRNADLSKKKRGPKPKQ